MHNFPFIAIPHKIMADHLKLAAKISLYFPHSVFTFDAKKFWGNFYLQHTLPIVWYCANVGSESYILETRLLRKFGFLLELLNTFMKLPKKQDLNFRQIYYSWRYDRWVKGLRFINRYKIDFHKLSVTHWLAWLLGKLRNNIYQLGSQSFLPAKIYLKHHKALLKAAYNAAFWYCSRIN